jgi:hypothetical protein
VSIYFLLFASTGRGQVAQCAKTESDEDLFLLGINPPLELSLTGF